MNISIIVAVAENNIIGFNEIIPWKIPGEQIRFKELTIGKTIVMGRKTYESIGKLLSNRQTIIVTRNNKYIAPNCVIVNSVNEALEISRGEKEIFIAGGGEIYKETINLASKIYLTNVHKLVKGNIFFPEIDFNIYEKTYEKYIDGEIPYTYLTYTKKVIYCKK